MFLKRKPANFLLWFLILIFIIDAFGTYNLDYSRVNFVTSKSTSDFLGNIIGINESRKVNIRASYEITGENYSLYYSSSFKEPNDFFKSKIRNLLYFFMSWLVFFSIYFSISRFFVNPVQAFSISVFGIFLSLLSCLFIQIDRSFLIKEFFSETIREIPAIRSYNSLESLIKTIISLILLVILVLISREIRSETQKLKLVKNHEDFNA